MTKEEVEEGDFEGAFDTSLEYDFSELVKKNYPKDLFIDCAIRMIGGDWTNDGFEIIKEHYPELLEQFKKYVD